MKKVLITILKIILLIICLVVSIFLYNCIPDTENEELLSELKGDILYIKRDTDRVLKIYKSKANLEDETLVYEHKGTNIDNNNILDFSIDEETGRIRFTAYSNELDNWGLYELNENNTATLIGNEPDNVYEYTNNIETDKYLIENIKGSLYITNKESNEKEVLKKFRGIYDGYFCVGYKPIKVSEDNKYLYYSYSGHPTPIGYMLEGLIFKKGQFHIYIMNLETKEVSKYVNFTQLTEK